MNKPINPARLLPAILSAVMNGTGSSSTNMSSTELLTAWPRNMAKNSSGSLLPQPMHLPGTSGSQFFAMGLHEKSARGKKVKPHALHTAIMPHVRRRER